MQSTKEGRWGGGGGAEEGRGTEEEAVVAKRTLQRHEQDQGRSHCYCSRRT